MGRRKTHEQFISELASINQNVKILGKYESSKTKIEVECLICGNQWKTTPHRLLNGNGCPKCAREKIADNRRKSHDEFVSELKDVNPNIKIIGKYKDSRTKIKCECLVCNNIWEATPALLLYGHGCTACALDSQRKKMSKTNDEFISELREKNPNLIPIDKYVNSNTKIRFKCSLCNHVFEEKPKNILSTYDCPNRCLSLSERTEIFYDKVKTVNPNIKILGKYKGAREKIEAQCLVCGNIWFPWATYLSTGRGCPECSRIAMMKTHDEFVSQIKEINPTIKILSPYNGGRSRIQVECTVCGNKWSPKANGLANGCGCPECAIIASRNTHEDFIKRLKERNDGVEILGEYVTLTTKIETRCKKCGFVWNAIPNMLMQGHGCPSCAKDALRKTHEEFVDEMKRTHPDLEVLSEYISCYENVTCRCKRCGRDFETTPDRLRCGYGCTICRQSKGERAIYNILESKGISFNPQHSFKDCRDVHVLPFDFYLPDLNIAIEYDGLQHYEPVERFGGVESFKVTQRHDKIKTDYCKQNKIRLIRIPYTEFNNIENIINKQIVA